MNLHNSGSPRDILGRVLSSDRDIALVCVTDISGGTLRPPGTLMAVSSEESFGYISAGCVDGDIIFQARQALIEGQTRHLIYGEGSPFKDIALPCGGRIDIVIIPQPDKSAIRSFLSELAKRERAVTLQLSDFKHDYQPELELRIVGRGEPFRALSQIAIKAGLRVHGQSPDQEFDLEEYHKFDHLTSPNPDHLPDIATDLWTAVVFLFHDHDWEPYLLRQALRGESFYIGAMGSPRTHSARLETLKAMGATGAERIRGPIGLIPAMRDANHLAISIMADIILEAQKRGLVS